MATSGPNSSTKAAIGVGVTVGLSLAGILLYVLVRRLLRRQQHQSNIVHAGTSTNAEVKPPRSKRYEKPELTGEDARHELDDAERRKVELDGEQTRIEMEALRGEDARKELDATERVRAELAGEPNLMESEASAVGNREDIHELSV